jgi:subfamily B ATP-binding cassette protein HlyB/CyaB
MSDDHSRHSAAHCLAIVAGVWGLKASPDDLIRRWAGGGQDFGRQELLRAAKELGLRAAARRFASDKLSTLPQLALVRTRNRGWLVFGGLRPTDGMCLVQQPGHPAESIPGVIFAEELTGEAVLLSNRAGAAFGAVRFGLRWFVTMLVKYHRPLRDVLAASLFIQLLALLTPLMFQVVMDKVLVHQSLSTLNVIAIGMVGVAVVEAGLTILRQILLTHTTCRIDVELGSKLFRHLFSLPLSYFHTRQVGQTIARVRELETIREFLTGEALTSIIDTLFIVVFVVVMFLYSWKLTLIALLAIPVYVAITVLVVPPLRAAAEELFRRMAVSQSFQVEAVSAVETIKAGAIEPQMQFRWENILASQVRQHYDLMKIAACGSNAVQLVSKLVYVAILYWGAKEVMGQALTVGELVAFTMFASHISQPIVRIAQLYQSFQQVRISIERLADILNTPSEPGAGSSTSAPPTLNGAIRFHEVGFRYAPEAPEVLRGVSLDIPAGTFVGIVGRSGSGKSTIARLIQRMYVPQSGSITIDGIEAPLLDPGWLRSRIGIVLQENVLFNRSVRENIALADPSLPMERIVEAAQAAGAHEFILRLPLGYDTLIEERGANLSGGQRQRLAIARELAKDPRILIFDEATSALDYETEAAIRSNLRAIRANRTTIMIAHRLGLVADAHVILVIDGGSIVQRGTHAELARVDGLYAHLLSQQGLGHV